MENAPNKVCSGTDPAKVWALPNECGILLSTYKCPILPLLLARHSCPAVGASLPMAPRLSNLDDVASSLVAPPSTSSQNPQNRQKLNLD
jgi:hypothetical protein